MTKASTMAAVYALCNSMGLFRTTDDEPKLLSLKFRALVSSTINSLELTTVSTTNSSAWHIVVVVIVDLNIMEHVGRGSKTKPRNKKARKKPHKIN